jgi:hypothetical protein
MTEIRHSLQAQLEPIQDLDEMNINVERPEAILTRPSLFDRVTLFVRKLIRYEA